MLQDKHYHLYYATTAIKLALGQLLLVEYVHTENLFASYLHIVLKF